jgi:hypothetical protein
VAENIRSDYPNKIELYKSINFSLWNIHHSSINPSIQASVTCFQATSFCSWKKTTLHKDLHELLLHGPRTSNLSHLVYEALWENVWPPESQADIQNPRPLRREEGGRRPSFVATASRDVNTRTLTEKDPCTWYYRLGCTGGALFQYKLD